MGPLRNASIQSHSLAVTYQVTLESEQVSLPESHQNHNNRTTVCSDEPDLADQDGLGASVMKRSIFLNLSCFFKTFYKRNL